MYKMVYKARTVYWKVIGSQKYTKTVYLATTFKLCRARVC